MSVLRLLVLFLCMHSAVAAGHDRPRREKKEQVARQVMLGIFGGLIGIAIVCGVCVVAKRRSSSANTDAAVVKQKNPLTMH